MGTTPNYAIPYPEPTDFVTDGATAMESIAEKVDDILSTGAAARNLLYNGAMQVAQRGTSVTSKTTGEYYTVDRWYFEIFNAGTWSMSQASSAVADDFPGATTGTYSGFRASAKITMTSAPPTLTSTSQVQVRQILEGQDLQAIRKGKATAQPVTVSFWVKASKSGTYILELLDADNTRQVSKSYTINATATWEYKTITFPADTTGMFDNDNAASLYCLWWVAAGSGYTSGTLNTTWATTTTANRAVGQVNLADATSAYWQVTGVQMTVGSVAPPFQFKSYQQELAECQRYFWRWVSKNAGDLYVSVYQPASTPFYYLIPMPVTMRARPSSASISGSFSYVNTPATPSVYDRGDSWMIIQSTVNSGIGAANQSAFFSVSGSSALEQSAELA